MVGFPGETEEDFLDLKNFVEKVKFEHLGCFTYSREEGTVAGRMPNQIEEEVKVNRQNEIMLLQQGISKNRLEAFIGKVSEVLVNGASEESDLLGEGRLPSQAPEVDGVVYINDGDLKPGQIQKIQITEAHEYDLVGRIL